MAEKIQFAPERRKGEQLARFGRGPSRMVGAPGELYRQLTQRRMTPNELAAWKLNQALEKYPEFTEEGRQLFQNEFVNMLGLRYMNMKVMAATLSFLNSNCPPTRISEEPCPIPKSFEDEHIIPYMSQLLPVNGKVEADEKQTQNNQEELRRLIIRFKAQILIYIRAIGFFRSE